MKTIRTFSVARLLLAVAAITMFTAAANAQTALRGTFHLDEEVRWGEAVLPSGDYTLSIATAQMPVQVTVRAADGKTTAMVLSNVADDVEAGGSALYITTRDGERKVRAINLPQLGISLQYERLTEAERESLDMAQNRPVSLVTARK